MLNTGTSALIIVDVQGKLAHRMHRKERLFEQLQKLIKGAQALSIPILWVEQNPEGLGPTIPEIADLLSDVPPIPKLSFSCCGCDRFMQALRFLNRKQILIAGIETHVCVYQTAVDLLNLGYEVQVVADAVSSRTEENRQIGLSRIEDAGGALTSTEMALFEMLKVAEGAQFKEILNIVK
ncbi:MAG: hydrolase [Candidatus Latescibacterota bacterium]|nr:MAG: hydrolase [Candidatus Latescibacterota bacterium]